VSLNISENKIGDSGIELLSKAFNENKSRLSKLYASNIDGTLAGFKYLFTGLRANQHLTHLVLNGNNFKTPPRFTKEQLRKA
jgi:hypothetical protein